MNKIVVLSVLSSLVFFSSCSSKKYFYPETTHNRSDAKSSFKDKIIFVNRDGATFSNGKYITRSGDGVVNLGDVLEVIGHIL